jgi:hypothetical protein
MDADKVKIMGSKVKVDSIMKVAEIEEAEKLKMKRKVEKILKYKPMLSLEKSLDKIIDYIKENKPKKFDYNHIIEIKNSLTPETWIKKLF